MSLVTSKLPKALSLSVACLGTASGIPLHAEETAAAAEVTRIMILGTAAGRTSWRGSETGSASTAIQVGEDVYVVDFGRDWADRYFEAGLGSPGKTSSPGGLDTLRAGFVTHMHSDHVVDLPRLVAFGASDGVRFRKTPVPIFGPGRRSGDSLREQAGGKELVNPDNPAPGIEDMFQSLLAAFATDLNDNMIDSGMPDPRTYLVAKDIELPAGIEVDPDSVAPAMEPFQIYADENVRVTAVLVDHAPIYPCFAFRFDTTHGSVVFSGDTNVNENLIKLAEGADVLVHEVIDGAWAEARYPEPRTDAQAAKLRHLLESHTDLRVVGDVAARAGVEKLVLSHLAPAMISQEDVDKHVTGFDGDVVLARPLTEVVLK